MKKIFILILLCILVFNSFSQEKRDFLQKEAKEIDLAKVLVKDFADLGFPTYQSRDFWNNLPTVIKQQYIQEGEKYLNYNWPIVKATDYLEIIRSGDRRQEVYAAPLAALMALVMGELTELNIVLVTKLISGRLLKNT